MIVGLVAAPENPLPLSNAIPMVMGANIGTTVTATVVSRAHLGRRDEFERAFPVAVCHDVFNYLAVLVLPIRHGDHDAATTTALILGTRYYKRIGGHVLNVLSRVVVPLDEVDYYDEDGASPSA